MLIADSGSTKTSWALISAEETIIYETSGFNPYYMPAGVFDKILSAELGPRIPAAAVKQLFYYGSGCSTKKNCAIVHDTLSKYFPQAGIEVQHDLLAAARALLGRDKGIACILGTGANSCAYDGDMITHNVPSLGYMFGDEGSGAYIGKIFLEAYLKGKLDAGINTSFEQEYGYSLSDILSRVYGPDNPSGFMASFMPFLATHQHHEDIHKILYHAFKDFFRESVSKYDDYKNLPVSFVGSVAYHFKHILDEVAASVGISIGRVEKAPMEGLIRFHREDQE